MRCIRIASSIVLVLLVLFALGCGKKTISSPPGTGVPPSSTSGSQSASQSGSQSAGGQTVKPYTVRGETYHPMISADGYVEEGLASWYGKDFHGRTTSNGETYNMYGQTAAHKLLPFGTQVRVTNLENGLSTVVRINDRGPFVANRIIDLTYTAASQLDIVNAGTAKVRVETIGTVAGLSSTPIANAPASGSSSGSSSGGSTTTISGASGSSSVSSSSLGTAATYDLTGSFYVQIGAFSNKTNADNALARLKSSGYNGRSVWVESRRLWRVQAGPWKSLSEAERMQESLSRTYNGPMVVAE